MILLPGIQAGPPEFWRLHLPDARILTLPEGDEDSLPAIAARLDLPDEPVDIVAASFGGLLAWALPPHRVRSLTTIGTLPWRTPAADRCGAAARLVSVLPDRVYRELYRPRVRRSLAEDTADDTILDAVRLPPRRTLAARLRAIAGFEVPAVPPFPTTFLWGATDPWVTWTSGALSARGLDGVVLPGGHRPHLSHPSEVAAWVSGRR